MTRLNGRATAGEKPLWKTTIEKYSVRTKFDNNDNVFSPELAKVVQQLIEKIGKLTDFETRQSFIEDFKIELGDEQLSKIKKIGVNLDNSRKILIFFMNYSG